MGSKFLIAIDVSLKKLLFKLLLLLLLLFNNIIGCGIESSEEDELDVNCDDDVGDLGFSMIDAPSTRLFVKPPKDVLFRIDDE